MERLSTLQSMERTQEGPHSSDVAKTAGQNKVCQQIRPTESARTPQGVLTGNTATVQLNILHEDIPSHLLNLLKKEKRN